MRYLHACAAPVGRGRFATDRGANTGAQTMKGADMTVTSEAAAADQDQCTRPAGAKLSTPGERRAASWAGWFMAITFITSIAALLLYHPVLHDHTYILGAGHDTRIEFAAL